MKKCVIAQLAILAALPIAAGAQAFQPGRLPAASRDSFDVVYQTQTIGAFIMALSRVGENVIFVGEAHLPRMGVHEIDSVTFHGATLAPISTTNNQTLAGMKGASKLAIGNGKATGTVQRVSPTGVQTTSIDAAVGPGIVVDGMEAALIPTLDFSEGLTHTFPAFDPKSGRTRAYKLEVLEKETVTVPAGTFEAWKIQLDGEDQVLLWVSTADPKKIVMLRMESAQMEMRRAK
jgi:hypothetical protein